MSIGKNGRLTEAPPLLADENGIIHENPPESLYIAAGYLRRVDTEPPKGCGYVSHYEARGRLAVQVWSREYPPAGRSGDRAYNNKR